MKLSELVSNLRKRIVEAGDADVEFEYDDGETVAKLPTFGLATYIDGNKKTTRHVFYLHEDDGKDFLDGTEDEGEES